MSKKMLVGVALTAALSLGLWQSAEAAKVGVKQKNTVKVYNCTQVGNDIQVSLKQNSPTMTLKAGCSNAGHGLRDYSFSCVSSKVYQVEWQTCPTALQITKLRVANATSGATLGTANSGYQQLGGKYAAKQQVTVSNKVTNLQFSLQTVGNTSTAGLTYGFVWTDTASDTINYDESLAKTLAANVSFTATASSNLPLTDYYRGRNVTLVAFVRNNDGVSKVPNMPVEVDDVIAIHLKVLPLPPAVVCNDLNGGNGAFTLCQGKTFTYSMSNLSVMYNGLYGNRANVTIGGIKFVVGEGQHISLLAADNKTVITFQVRNVNKVQGTINLRVNAVTTQ